MKSLVRKLANTNIGILLRNSLNFRPVYLKNFEKNYPISVSDAFFGELMMDIKQNLSIQIF